MPRPSAFARGFRALRREPSVLLAEIAWRWLFGGIATALLAWATIVFLRAIEVSKANQFLLSTLNPELMSYALRDLFHNKWGMLGRLGIIIGISLSFLWIITATIARSATTRVLLERSADDYAEQRDTRPNLRAVATIQFLRVALLWIGLAAYFLSAVIASRLTTSGDQPHVGAFLFLFLCMFLVAAAVLSFFNWILLLAPIFAIRDDHPFSDATIAAAHFSRCRSGSLIGLNLAHLAIRIVWIVFISGIALAPFGFARILPKWVIFAAVLITTLIYSAVADALFVARYAGYIEIAEQEAHPEPEPDPLPPPSFGYPPVAETPVPAEPALAIDTAALTDNASAEGTPVGSPGREPGGNIQDQPEPPSGGATHNAPITL